MTLAGEDPTSEKNCRSTTYSKGAWQSEIKDNLKELDRKIGAKVSSNFTSVRQAFLKID